MELGELGSEHNQEADYLVNLETEGQTRITIEGVQNIEEWKAIRGYWDGSKKKRKEWMWNCDQRYNGKWISSAAEIAGVSMLTYHCK